MQQENPTRFTRGSEGVHEEFTRGVGNEPSTAGSRLEPRPRRVQPPQTFSCLDLVDLEVLLALAWLAPITTGQIYRLIAPAMAVKQLQRHLRRLTDNGFIGGALHYSPGEGRTPRRAGYVWSLRPRGEAVIAGNDRVPAQPARIRQALVRHDLLISALLSWLVPAVRPILGGLWICREQRVYPADSKPKCDALVELNLTDEPGASAVPWCQAPPVPGAARKRYAVEADCGTEGRSIIREKAAAYRRVFESRTTQGDFRMPLPLWVVSDRMRANLVTKAWVEVWPEGRWLITTADQLPDLIFTEYREGTQRLRHLLTGWTA